MSPELAMGFQTFLNGLMLALVYMLFASGLALTFSIMGLLNFAHGAIYTFGAYAVFYTFSLFGASFASYGLSIIIAVLFCGLVGLVMERFLFRPFLGRIIPQIIIAIGLSIVFSGATLVICGERQRGVESLITGSISWAGLVLPYSRLSVIVISALIMIGLVLLIKYTKLGYFMRAVTQDLQAARLQGVKLTMVTMIAFTMSCALAGFAGAFIMSVFNITTPTLGNPVLITALIVILLGGLGSIPGVIVASLVVGFLHSFVGTYIGGGVVAQLISFIMVYIILIVRPRGLMGEHA